VLGGILLAQDQELFEYKGRATSLDALIEFLSSGVVTSPFQQRVVASMRVLRADGMPIDLLTVFGRFEGASNSTAFELTRMASRVVHSQHVLVWVLLGYEFRITAQLCELICAPRNLNGEAFKQIEAMATELRSAILGQEDRIEAFEQCCLFMEQYLLGLSFAQEASEMLQKHRERIATLKTTKNGVQTL
jgi:hypothetical protein